MNFDFWGKREDFYDFSLGFGCLGFSYFNGSFDVWIFSRGVFLVGFDFRLRIGIIRLYIRKMKVFLNIYIYLVVLKWGLLY